MAKPQGWIRRLLFMSGVLLLLAAGSVAVPNLVVAYAAKGYEYEAAWTVPAKSVAIVPGCDVRRGQPGIVLRDRLEGALGLYRKGRVKTILLSGNDSSASPEVTVMHAWLRDRGVPVESIWTDSGGNRTRETMRRAAGLFGVTDAVVCTQGPYMPRALFLAHTFGIDAVGLSVPTRLPQSMRTIGREAMKTILAFVESNTREGPQDLSTDRAQQTPLAAR